MDIDQKYKHLIHTDATALLRPKTGLKDMFVELNPGSTSAPIAKPGYTIPVANTSRTSTPTRSSPRSTPTPARTSTCSSTAPARGSSGTAATELAQVLERFEPTHRDLARLNRVVAARGANLRRLVNSLQRLNTALAHEAGPDRAAGRLELEGVPARSPRENQNVSRAIADLPGDAQPDHADACRRCRRSRRCSGRRRRNLLPAAGALPAANHGAERAREAEHADRSRPDPAVRDRAAPDWCAT